jgi:hypothetical protein
MKNKPLISLLPLAFLAWACHSRPGATTGGITIADSVLHKVEVAYTGKFNKGLISLVINYLDGNTVSGYDVHAGQRRNLNGEVTQQGKVLNFVLKEPGGNPTDGRFEFALDPDSMKLVGTWTPFDSTKATAHTFTLTRGKIKITYDDVWRGEESTDTLLTLKPDGTCTFAFYPHTKTTTDTAKKIGDSAATAATDSTGATPPENPTDQIITVRGNYTKEGLSYKFEWEKNSYIPLHMTMVKELKEYKGDDGTSSWYPVALKGNGYALVPAGEDDGESE